MRFFETHAHYDDEQFRKDVSELLPALYEAGVETIINCASDLASCRSTLKLAEQYPFVYAAIGVHPQEVGTLEEEAVSELYGYARSSEKVVAIGEIGLDYHYDSAPRDVQQDWFCEQIELARELELPIIVHSRDAAEDTFRILRDSDGGMNGGVVHSYTGGPELAKEYCRMGFYIGVGGMVTFPKVRKILDTVRELPTERLLIETDSPYLAPVPNRGQRNDSRNLRYIVEKIGEIKGIPPEDVARITMENARNLFGLAEA